MARIGGDRNAQKDLAEKPAGKRPVGKAMHVQEFLRSIGMGENWIHLAQDSETSGAVVNTVMELRGS